MWSTVSIELCTLFKKLVQKVAKKRTSNMKVYCTIPLNYQLTGHPENFKIKLYYFQERLSLQYNIIMKLLSLFHICISSMMSTETIKSKYPDEMHYLCRISMVGDSH